MIFPSFFFCVFDVEEIVGTWLHKNINNISNNTHTRIYKVHTCRNIEFYIKKQEKKKRCCQKLYYLFLKLKFSSIDINILSRTCLLGF